MGVRTIVVDNSTISKNLEKPSVLFRPDVLLVGDILFDPSYEIQMIEIDSIMEIQINKKKEEGK